MIGSFSFFLFLNVSIDLISTMKAKTRMSVSSDHTTYIKCCWTFDLFRKKEKKKYKILFWVIKLFFKVTENKNVQFISPSYLCLKVTRTFSGVSFFTLVQYVQQRLQCIMYTVLAAPLASTPDSDFANLCVSQQMGSNTRFVNCLQRWIITFPVLSLSYWHDNTLSY